MESTESKITGVIEGLTASGRAFLKKSKNIQYNNDYQLSFPELEL